MAKNICQKNIIKQQEPRTHTHTDLMPAPRKALVNRKTPVAMASHVLNAVDELLAMDKSLRKEGKQPLIIADGGANKEREYLESARLVLSGILIRARKLQKAEFDAACCEEKIQEEGTKAEKDGGCVEKDEEEDNSHDETTKKRKK